MLACVQASAVTPRALAEALAALWRRVVSTGEDQTFRIVDDLGLTFTQVKALHNLRISEQPLSVGELSERLGLSLPATSRAVDGLARKGWLERREDEHDRRMKRVTLTAEGADVATRIADARMQGLEAFAASLSDEHRARLAAALEEL
jgi:DNA-binding MarR family transcriptional regulator